MSRLHLIPLHVAHHLGMAPAVAGGWVDTTPRNGMCLALLPGGWKGHDDTVLSEAAARRLLDDIEEELAYLPTSKNGDLSNILYRVDLRVTCDRLTAAILQLYGEVADGVVVRS